MLLDVAVATEPRQVGRRREVGRWVGLGPMVRFERELPAAELAVAVRAVLRRGGGCQVDGVAVVERRGVYAAARATVLGVEVIVPARVL